MLTVIKNFKNIFKKKRFLIFIIIFSFLIYYISDRYLSYLQLFILLLFAAGESLIFFLMQKNKFYLLYLHAASLLTSLWIISFADPNLFYPLTYAEYYNFDFYLLIYPALIFISLFFTELFPAKFSKTIILMISVYSFLLLLLSMLSAETKIYLQLFVCILNIMILIYFTITIARVHFENEIDVSDFLWALIFFSTMLIVFYADYIFDLNIEVNLQAAVFTFILILDIIMLKIMSVERKESRQNNLELETEKNRLKKSLEIKQEFIKDRMTRFDYLEKSILSSQENIMQNSNVIREDFEEKLAEIIEKEQALSYFAANTAEYLNIEDKKNVLDIKKYELKEILEEALQLSKIYNYENEVELKNLIKANKYLVETDKKYFKQLFFTLFDIIISSAADSSIFLNAELDKKISLNIIIEADNLIFMRSDGKMDDNEFDTVESILEFKYLKLNQLLDILDIEMKFEKMGSTKMQLNLKLKGSIYNDFYEVKELKKMPELNTEFEKIKMTTKNNRYYNSRIIIYSKADENNLKLLEDFNILSDYSFIKVKTEEELLEQSDSDTVLVIIDIYSLTDEEINICSSIRERFKFFELPILIVASHNLPQNLLKSYEIGINDFVKKPFEINELRSRIRTLITLKAKVEESLQREQDYLRAQIKPHFLYNTLDTIAYLCETNTSLAGELIIDLANYLRYSFDFDSSDQFVPIEKELDLVKFYTSIQKERFKDKFEIIYHIDGELDFKIPPFVIQELVENSLKHGLKKTKNNYLIEIFVKEEKHYNQIKVRDNGVGIEEAEIEKVFSENSSSEERHKIGLKNINQRLKRQFNESIDIEQNREGTAVKFKIPK